MLWCKIIKNLDDKEALDFKNEHLDVDLVKELAKFDKKRVIVLGN